MRKAVPLTSQPRYIRGTLVEQPVSPYPIHTEGQLTTLRVGVVVTRREAEKPTLPCSFGASRLTLPPLACLSIGAVEESPAGSIPYAGISGRKSLRVYL